MIRMTRLAAFLASLVLLSACLLTPGKFTSTLDIRKDHSFTFTYQGEVIAQDFGDQMKGLGKESGPEDPGEDEASSATEPDGKSAEDATEKEAKLRAMADALAKEKGFRSVRYVDNDTLEIDYAISGRIDHSFLFPFNSDAQAVLPFIAVEVRQDNKVRVQAPGFGSSDDKTGGMGGGDSSKRREGTFTLTTDAEIVSQNQEEGATRTGDGKRLVWKVTPLTRTAPMAVLALD
ncbi:MAG: hypothetical protein AB7U35_09050 [Sphingobium sp.]